MQVYDFKDYREGIRLLLHRRKKELSIYNFENLARACRVHKTYLSRVLKGKGRLSSDQIYRAGSFLGLVPPDIDYLQILKELDETEDEGRRKLLSARSERLRQENLKTQSRLTASVQTPGVDFVDYYLEPKLILIHMFLTVPRFASDPSLIVTALGLPALELARLLSRLESLGIIEKRGKRYVILRDNLHLSPDSSAYAAHRLGQRFNAMERLAKLPKDRGYSFSATFSTTAAVAAQIREGMLDIIKTTEKQVIGSAQDEVYQLNIDLFDWSL